MAAFDPGNTDWPFGHAMPCPGVVPDLSPRKAGTFHGSREQWLAQRAHGPPGTAALAEEWNEQPGSGPCPPEPPGNGPGCAFQRDPTSGVRAAVDLVRRGEARPRHRGGLPARAVRLAADRPDRPAGGPVLAGADALL